MNNIYRTRPSLQSEATIDPAALLMANPEPSPSTTVMIQDIIHSTDNPAITTQHPVAIYQTLQNALEASINHNSNSSDLNQNMETQHGLKMVNT